MGRWNPAGRATIWSSGPLADSPWVLAVFPDGSRWAVGSRSGRVTLWDAKTRTVLVSIAGSEFVSSVGFSPDGSDPALDFEE